MRLTKQIFLIGNLNKMQFVIWNLELNILSCFGTHFCHTCLLEFVCFESTLKGHTPCPLKNLRLPCFLIITGTWNIMLYIYGVMMMVCA